MKDLKNKVIIITGSSRKNGMGAATARIAAKQGAKVVVHGSKDSESLQGVAEETGAVKIICDIRDKQAVLAEVDRVVAELGSVDMLVTCAGVAGSKPFMELDDVDWDEMFDVNFLGTVNFCQAVIPHMQSQGKGSIVTVSSTRGMTELASTRNLPYCVSKAAVNSLTIALAKEVGPQIRVNCVAPGGTETDMAATWSGELREKYTKESLIGKIIQPEDIANTILYLATDASAALSGQIILADGGYKIYGK